VVSCYHFKWFYLPTFGIEMIGLSAGEAENPTKTIPMAIDSLAWRILIFYVGALFVILAIFPWHQVGQQGSPFVAMFESIGLREAAGIINFVVITAALSSCNAGIFSGGRLLLGLSKIGNAPQALGEVSKSGVPMKAILMTILLPNFGSCLELFCSREGISVDHSSSDFDWLIGLDRHLIHANSIQEIINSSSKR